MSNKRSHVDYVKIKNKVLRIEDEEQDPLLNLGFKRTKTAAVPDQDQEIPVMHDDTPTMTKKEKKHWNIPAAVSNWKNTKGFMIDLDKRMATNKEDGEEQSTVNKGFANLSAALYKAEQNAKEELKEKAKLKEEVERMAEIEKSDRLGKIVSEITQNDTTNSLVSSTAKSREQRRAERRKRALEEMNTARSASTSSKIRSLVKEQNRDVSERVILGASESLRKRNTEESYDSTLFLNAAVSAGRDSSKSGELYDRPLFAAQDALNGIYRSRSTLPTKTMGLGVDGDDEEQHVASGEAVKFVKDEER